MKHLLLVIILLSSFMVAHAETERWIEGNSHPLWEALEVEPTTGNNGIFDYEIKNAGVVTCSKSTLMGGGPLSPRQVQTTCEFPTEMTGVEIYEFSEFINDDYKVDNPGSIIDIKVVDKLMLTIDDADSNNSSELFISHPCINVNSLKEASKCMNFWSDKIITSYNADNVAHTMNSSQKISDSIETVITDYFGYKDTGAVNEADAADYVAIVSQAQDEHHLLYYVVPKGNNVFPQLIYTVNMADSMYKSKLSNTIKSTPEEEMSSLFESVYKTFLLGTKSKKLSDFKDILEFEFENALVD